MRSARKVFLTLLAAGALAMALDAATAWVAQAQPPISAQVIIQAPPPPPPPPQEQVYIEPPSPRHVWVPGHWVWHGAWIWEPGHWAHRPHPRAVWVPGHWERQGHGWVWMSGYWR